MRLFTNTRAARDFGQWLLPLFQLSLSVQNSTSIDPFAKITSSGLAPSGTTSQSNVLQGGLPVSSSVLPLPTSTPTGVTTSLTPTLPPVQSSSQTPSPTPTSISNFLQPTSTGLQPIQLTAPPAATANLPPGTFLSSLIPGQKFRIRSQQSQLLVSVPASNINAGTGVTMQADGDSSYIQSFMYLDNQGIQVFGTQYVLTAAVSPVKLGIYGGYNVILAGQIDSSDNSMQRFTYDPSHAEIISVGATAADATNTVFDVDGRNTTVGTPLIAYKENDQSNQMFNLESI